MTKILDCTLRDGGYYTNWDFSDSITNVYFESMNNLPIDYLEVGYRSNPMNEYLGKYYYCPIYLLEQIKQRSTKKLVIILNEKDVQISDINHLLGPIKGIVTMIRLAIDPKNFKRALNLAEAIKNLGFEVGFNVMYMSKWKEEKGFLEEIKNVSAIADVFYMVDSYGGVFPEDIRSTFELVRDKSDVPIGFHGHNNMEMGLINTLTAIECGVSYVDATITGMGRGAGNLKTELLLTALNSQNKLKVDFNALSKVVSAFTDLQSEYQWGTNLPYMVSGAHSLPQKDVMDWMSKRYYSLNSIIRALTNKTEGKIDNVQLSKLNLNEISKSKEVLIVGGGPSVTEHSAALQNFVKANPELTIIHASSKNARIFEGFSNDQYFCLMGNEGHRLEEVFGKDPIKNGICILPPYPRQMGTYIPEALENKAFELPQVEAIESYSSQTAMALSLARQLAQGRVYVAGYDGYSGVRISTKDQDLFIENEDLFRQFSDLISLVSITPSRYSSIIQQSVYQFV